MVSGTMPNDLDVYVDGDDPTEPGDIKVVLGTVVPISYCDQVDDDDGIWTVEGTSTAGTSFYSIGTCVEGSGSLFIYVPASGTGRILYTPDADINLSTCDKIRFSLNRAHSFRGINLSNNITFHAHIGENGYGGAGESTMGNFTLTDYDTWYNKIWDISAVADADKNEVNYFVLDVANGSATKDARVYLDYVYGDPGPSSIKGYDGDKVIVVYPKVYTDYYSGSNAHQTITIARKGTPSYIMVHDPNTPSVLFWISGLGETCFDSGGTVIGAGVGIHNVTDCTFDVSATYSVAGNDYYYVVEWAD